MCGLTVELRGRIEAPNQSRGCILSYRASGDTTEHHGPLQRLLDNLTRCANCPYRAILTDHMLRPVRERELSLPRARPGNVGSAPRDLKDCASVIGEQHGLLIRDNHDPMGLEEVGAQLDVVWCPGVLSPSRNDVSHTQARVLYGFSAKFNCIETSRPSRSSVAEGLRWLYSWAARLDASVFSTIQADIGHCRS